MVFGVKRNDAAKQRVADLCGKLPAFVRSMRNRFPEADVSCVLGFGAEFWGWCCKGLGRPKELETFKEIRGKKHVAVSTPGDLLLHVRSGRKDACNELGAQIADVLGDAVTPVDEVQGYRYFDGRAIIGFVDGTENPEGDDRTAFAAIGDEDPAFTGGSYVFVQKYLHDMQGWNALSVEEQEKAIGRRKFDDVELEDDVKPENAHNAVTNISDKDGNELKIVRANMAFSNPTNGEYGTYFIGYAATFSTTRKMLENMFVGEPEGNTDRLLDFSKAVTGTLFFAPSMEMLETIADAE
jgi:putative iron-dependent peroxidase